MDGLQNEDLIYNRIKMGDSNKEISLMKNNKNLISFVPLNPWECFGSYRRFSPYI